MISTFLLTINIALLDHFKCIIRLWEWNVLYRQETKATTSTIIIIICTWHLCRHSLYPVIWATVFCQIERFVYYHLCYFEQDLSWNVLHGALLPSFNFITLKCVYLLSYLYMYMYVEIDSVEVFFLNFHIVLFINMYLRMCLYVLSSVLWCPWRFPHKNNVLFVFTSSCL